MHRTTFAWWCIILPTIAQNHNIPSWCVHCTHTHRIGFVRVDVCMYWWWCMGERESSMQCIHGKANKTSENDTKRAACTSEREKRIKHRAGAVTAWLLCIVLMSKLVNTHIHTHTLKYTYTRIVLILVHFYLHSCVLFWHFIFYLSRSYLHAFTNTRILTRFGE